MYSKQLMISCLIHVSESYHNYLIRGSSYAVGVTQFSLYLAQPRSSYGLRRDSFDIACYLRKGQVLEVYERTHPCDDRQRAGRFDDFLSLINCSTFDQRSACRERHEAMGGTAWLHSIGLLRGRAGWMTPFRYDTSFKM